VAVGLRHRRPIIRRRAAPHRLFSPPLSSREPLHRLRHLRAHTFSSTALGGLMAVGGHGPRLVDGLADLVEDGGGTSASARRSPGIITERATPAATVRAPRLRRALARRTSSSPTPTRLWTHQPLTCDVSTGCVVAPPPPTARAPPT
jgi:hypothetical protein